MVVSETTSQQGAQRVAQQIENPIASPAPLPALSLVLGADKTALAREWRRYDRMLGPAGNRVLDVLKLAAGERVLDVGCGSGGVTLAAAHRVGGTGAAAGIDADSDAIHVARTRAREQLLGWATFAAADVERAELPGWAFDAIVSRFGITNVVDPAGALARLARCLVPGGRMAFVCWRAAADNAWYSLPRGVIESCFGAEVARGVNPCGLGARSFAFADRDRLEEWLSRAGFVEASIEPFDGPTWVGDDVDDALEFFFETDGRPLDDLLDQKRFALLTRELGKALSAHERSGGVWVPAAAWLVSARTGSTLLAG
jgi:SAM-dependent methyltransferase